MIPRIDCKHVQPRTCSPKPTRQDDRPSVPRAQDCVELSASRKSIADKLGIWARPSASAVATLAAGATVAALGASCGAPGLIAAAGAVVAGTALGTAIGVVGTEDGTIGANILRFVQGSLNGLVGATGGLVGGAAFLGLAAGGPSVAVLSTLGAVAVGGAGLIWGISKLADCLTG